MKNRNKSTLTLLLAAVLLAAQTGCHSRSGKPVNVVVIMGNDKEYALYREYLEEIDQTFLKGGYNPTLRPLYMDVNDNDEDNMANLVEFRHTLEKDGFKPDLILMQGDRLAQIICRTPHDSIFNFHDIPIVLGGLHTINAWKQLRTYENIALWNDPMDFQTNINLAVELSGMNAVVLELDWEEQDMYLREELKAQINRPPYVDNSDFHVSILDVVKDESRYKDSIVVGVYSVSKPWQNTNHPEEDDGVGEEKLERIQILSSRYPCLVVKRDIYGNLIASRSGNPEFTAIRKDFGSGSAEYLAGYFASYKTIAHDISQTGISILGGARPNRIKVKDHVKNFWMDYDAMEIMGLKYDDYKDDYQIVNAPFSVAHRTEYLMILTALYTCLGLMILLLGVWMFVRRNRKLHADRKRLEEARYITQLCMRGADSYALHSTNEVQEYLTRYFHGQEQEQARIMNSLHEPGSYQFQLQGKVGDSDKEEYWEFRYMVREDGSLNGLLMNVDEHEAQKRKMKMAIQDSISTKKKENFMLKTSREINTPLTAIQQYCDRLTAEDVSEEEKRELTEKITANSDKLTTIIGDILRYSRIESGRQQYFIRYHTVEPIMKELHQNWLENCPEKIRLILRLGRDDTQVLADRDRLVDILNQFVSNALKFTAEGTAIIGWKYHLGKNQVEFFVEDTGEGISEMQQENIFSLFWKKNDFVPGVGLGLNIAKRLSDNMDGQITIASKEGLGTRFSLWLPGKVE